MRGFCLSLILVATVSCDRTFEGQLQVNKEITLKSGRSWVTIAEGDYHAHLSGAALPRRLIVRLDDDRRQTYSLRIPRNFTMPDEGDFFIDGDIMGQLYDVKGHIAKEVEKEGPYRDWAHCTYQCGYDTRHEGPGQHYDGDGCPTEPVYCDGQYEYEYNLVTETRDLDSLILAADDSDDSPSARFAGRNVYTYQEVLWQSACR